MEDLAPSLEESDSLYHKLVTRHQMEQQYRKEFWEKKAEEWRSQEMEKGVNKEHIETIYWMHRVRVYAILKDETDEFKAEKKAEQEARDAKIRKECGES